MKYECHFVRKEKTMNLRFLLSSLCQTQMTMEIGNALTIAMDVVSATMIEIYSGVRKQVINRYIPSIGEDTYIKFRESMRRILEQSRLLYNMEYRCEILESPEGIVTDEPSLMYNGTLISCYEIEGLICLRPADGEIELKEKQAQLN